MNQNWQSFLLAEGATIDGDGILHFPKQTLSDDWINSTPVLFDLSGVAALRVSGKDAEAFLQSQFSNDINRVRTEQICQLNAYCNPKGRTIALTRVFSLGDDFILMVPCCLVDAVVKRLRMFVMRSKVTIDQDTNLVMTGIAGTESKQLLQNLDFDTPGTVGQVIHSRELTLIQVPGPTSRFISIGEFDAVANTWQQLKSAVPLAGPREWALLDLLSGQPNIFSETSELFVPQMLNLDHIDGISFEKGCYPGQEIVARMHYLGKPKRRMILAKVETSSPPNLGDDLYDETRTQSAGKVVDAQRMPTGELALLAVIQIESYKNSPVHLQSPDGPVLTWLPLPYDLPLA